MYILEKNLRNDPKKYEKMELEFKLEEEEKRFLYRILCCGERINDIYQTMNIRKQMAIPPKDNDKKLFSMVNDFMRAMDSMDNECRRYLEFLNERRYKEGTLEL